MAERARVDEERRELPVTSYAILGLLTFGERSGYDLVKLIDQSIGYFFTPAKSQIYSELRRLVSVGYATEREVSQERRPDKRLYAATEEGRRALRRWLEVPQVPPDEIKSPFMVKLFFGRHMDPEAVLDQLEQMREQAREYLQQLQTIERAIKNEPDLFYPYLTLKCGLAYGRAQLRWVNQTIREVQEREGA